MKAILAAIGIGLLSTGALANNFSGNSEMYGSILNDHGKGGPTGSLEASQSKLSTHANYGSVLFDLEEVSEACIVAATPDVLENRDMYGSILADLVPDSAALQVAATENTECKTS